MPKVDGRFGFLYRTEDGIAHGAKSEGDGIVSGRYSYTDPTGLKVNFNYNAGTRKAPGYNYNEPINAYTNKISNNYNDPISTYANKISNNYNDQNYQDNRGRDFYMESRSRSYTRPNRNDVY